MVGGQILNDIQTENMGVMVCQRLRNLNMCVSIIRLLPGITEAVISDIQFPIIKLLLGITVTDISHNYPTKA